MCGRSEVVFNVEGVEAAVNLLTSLLSGATMAIYPSENDVRIEGINVLSLIKCNVYEGI